MYRSGKDGPVPCRTVRRALCWGTALLLVKAPDRGGWCRPGLNPDPCFPGHFVQLQPEHLASCCHSCLHIPSLKDHPDYCLLYQLLQSPSHYFQPFHQPRYCPDQRPMASLSSPPLTQILPATCCQHPECSIDGFLTPKHCICHAHPVLCCCLMASSCFSAFRPPGGTLKPHRTLGWLPVVLELNVDVLLAWS